MATAVTKPKIIFRNGKPQAVILGIKRYESLLQAIENKKDLTELRRLKRGKTSFRKLDEYLS